LAEVCAFGALLLLPPPRKLHFAFVCLSVNRIGLTQKICRQILTNFSERWDVTSNERLDFGGNTDHDADPGFLKEFLSRVGMQCRQGAILFSHFCPSVCQSVCVSVLCRYCVKTNGHIVTLFWHSG